MVFPHRANDAEKEMKEREGANVTRDLRGEGA